MKQTNIHRINMTEQTTSVVLSIGEDVMLSHNSPKVEDTKENLSVQDNLSEHLIRAINNRTRERNYFRLCLELAQGNISESEFENEIIHNENDYVIRSDIEISPNEIKMFLDVAPSIKGIYSLEDLQDAFSISPTSAMKAL